MNFVNVTTYIHMRNDKRKQKGKYAQENKGQSDVQTDIQTERERKKKSIERNIQKLPILLLLLSCFRTSFPQTFVDILV